MASKEIAISKADKVTFGMRAKSIFLHFKPNEAKAADLAKQFESAGDYYLAQGNARKAEKAYVRSLELAARASCEAGFLLLLENKDVHNITAAQRHFNLALKNDPEYAKAYYGMAIVERTNNNYRKGHHQNDDLYIAIRYLRIALEKGFPAEKIYPKLLDEIREYEKNPRIDKGKELRRDLKVINGKLTDLALYRLSLQEITPPGTRI